MRRPWIICLAGIVSLVYGAFPATAAAAGSSTADVSALDAVEGGFRLTGSHGYSISALAYSEGIGQRGTIEFIVRRRAELAAYLATASLTADTIQANLGRIGRVALVRHPSGRTKTVHLRCLGAQTYEPATYEGIVEFNGEEGYTRARVSQVAALPAWFLFVTGPCGSGYGEAIGFDEPGARLRGLSVAHGRVLSYQVNKNSPKARMLFKASLKERRSGIRIVRESSGVAPASAFRFDPLLRTASLSPPAPFSGSAFLSRSPNSFGPILTGDLTLDFPGRSDVPVAGHDVQVSLVHARFTRSSDSTVGIAG